jgi:hypothetical protein
MRTLKLTLLAALALAMGVSAANAASVDVIWHISGTATTIVQSESTVVTGNIVLTPSTPLVGAGSVIELSADLTGALGYLGSVQTLLGGWLVLGNPIPAGSHIENVIAQGDLLGYGAPVAGPTIIGTITVHSPAGPGSESVTVQASGPADDIFSGPNSVLGEYVFNPGYVTHIPEPTTASLLGLGLIGLAFAGRRRS